MKSKILALIACVMGVLIFLTCGFFIHIFFIGNPQVNSNYIEDIKLTDNLVKIKGSTSSSGDSFRGYNYSIKGENLYIELIYVLTSKFYTSPDFNIQVNDDFSNIDNVYLTDGKNNKLIWNRGIPKIYTYTGNFNADGIEIDEIIDLNDNNSIIDNLNMIKNKLIEKHFNGIDIKIVDVKDNILTIDMVDKSKNVMEYLNSGSSGSKIYLDILRYSFLQPESNVKNWVGGLKVLLNGEENVEGDHFNFSKIFYREQSEKTLATIKDYGYEDTPYGYKDKYVAIPNSEQFVITPINDETEIIITEVNYNEYGFSEGEELYRTNNPLLFVLELPEGAPYIQVKLKYKDRTSTWHPFFNGRDGTLIVPAEFCIK